MIIRLSDEEVFSTDSTEYEILADAVNEARDIPGAIVEIGTRRGGSAKIMMDTLANSGSTHRPFFCIDPYGNIETQLTNHNITKFYQNIAKTEGDPDSKALSAGVRLDYNNAMRNRVIPSLYYYAFNLGFNFTFFCLEDSEFMLRYRDGVPVYDQEKELVNQYACVFFDGPHTNEIVMDEVLFFNGRMPVGATAIFDDIWQYEHDELIEKYLFDSGWELMQKGNIKASYRKIS